MSESQKMICIKKYLVLPTGILTLLVTSLPVYAAFIAIFGQSFCLKTRIILYLGILIFLLLIVLYVNYYIKPAKKTGPTLYVMISPESYEDDKYIADLVDGIRNGFRFDSEDCPNCSLSDMEIIVPNIICRNRFNMRISKGAAKRNDYFKTKRWKFLHRWLKGTSYISGIVKTRENDGQKFIFNLQTTVSYSKGTAEKIEKYINAMINEHAASHIMLDRKYGYEQILFLSRTFADIIEFFLGLTYLSGGRFALAYQIHMKLHKDNRSGFTNEKFISDVNHLTMVEYTVMANDLLNRGRLAEVIKLSREHSNVYPKDSTALIILASSIIRNSYSTEEYMKNLVLAENYMDRVHVSTENREVYSVNVAYLALLSGKYNEAKKYYTKISKNVSTQVAKQVLDYCNDTLKDEKKVFEYPAALYVKALMMIRLNMDQEKIISDLNDLLKIEANGTGFFREQAEYLSKCTS